MVCWFLQLFFASSCRFYFVLFGKRRKTNDQRLVVLRPGRVGGWSFSGAQSCLQSDVRERADRGKPGPKGRFMWGV